MANTDPTHVPGCKARQGPSARGLDGSGSGSGVLSASVGVDPYPDALRGGSGFQGGVHTDRDEYGPENVDNAPTITVGELQDEIASNRATYEDAGLGPCLVVDGRNVAVRVRNGCLEIEDGVHPYRRKRTVGRAETTQKVQRVIVLGAGMITTEAMAWCHQQGLPVVVARTFSTPTMINAASLFDSGGIRRAQALSAYTPMCMDIVRLLLDKRLTGQADIALRLLGRDDQSDAIHALRRRLLSAATPEEAMVVEANAGKRYWDSWEKVTVRFAATDRKRIPEHWYKFKGRRSPLGINGWSNRHAGDPINALLNLGYKIAETEAGIACLRLGLDPSLGWAHADRQDRPAAILDLMEVARDAVEATVLELLGNRTLRKADFAEGPTGEVRVRAPLSHEVIGVLVPLVAGRVGPSAENVAKMLGKLANTSIVPVLTGTREKKEKAPKKATFAKRCHRCGKTLSPTLTHRSYCDECWQTAKVERDLAVNGSPRTRKRPQRVEYATESGKRRAETMRERVATQRAWEESHKGMVRPDPSEFAPIAESLARIPLVAIAQTMGTSRSAASQVRSGRRVPHVRHWEPLAALARKDHPGAV